jgi:hypothetical protein
MPKMGRPANLRSMAIPNPPRFPYPRKVYPPLNRCAYCTTGDAPSTEALTSEHIIPFGFGGELILPNASCAAHQTATSKVEAFVLRKYLCALRSHLGLPSRKPLQRPDGYPLKLRSGLHSWKKKVKLADHPGIVRFVMFEPAGRVIGRVREPETFSFRLIDAKIFQDVDERLARLGADSFEDGVTVKAIILARFIAKIGHSFAIAELGFGAFEELYVTHLVSSDARDWSYWVGGYDRGRDVRAGELHELRFLRRGDDLSVIVHLLVPYCPRYGYEVIVGRIRPGVEIPVELDENYLKWSPAKLFLGPPALMNGATKGI